jgi:hypothetical protein
LEMHRNLISNHESFLFFSWWGLKLWVDNVDATLLKYTTSMRHS